MPHAEFPMAQVVGGKISEMKDAEVIIERPEGSRITVIVNICPLKAYDGKITGAINCFYDITERQQMERELQADIHRCKDQFLSMLSQSVRD